MAKSGVAARFVYRVQRRRGVLPANKGCHVVVDRLPVLPCSHELSRCSTCKRSSARELEFTLCEKTCDACCLKKRKHRFYAKRIAPLYEDDETKRQTRANEVRKCSTCKCWKNIGSFESIGRKTCMQCLQSRQLARTRAKCSERNSTTVAESAQVICTQSFGVNSWHVLL